MNTFLQSARKALTSGQGKVTIVVGNESCDLDSMTSAILYAWFRGHQQPEKAFSKRYIPLLNIPRDDIKLRPEFKTVLDQCGIDTGSLTTHTDLPSPDNLPVTQTQWILVDHNKLEGDLGSLYSGQVIGCIDHHEEENSVPKKSAPEPRIIEKCGSCTSLVLRELAPELAKNGLDLEDKLPYTTEALKLGLSSVLIDTNNLQDKNKTTKVDADIAGYIDAILHQRHPSWNKDAFFNEISESKKNLDGLSLNDVLRKDYKQWTEGNIKLGMSSVVRNLEFLVGLSRDQSTNTNGSSRWTEDATKFMADRQLDVWAIMTAYTAKTDDGKVEFKRQLMIHWKDDTCEKVVQAFEKQYGSELELEHADVPHLTPGQEDHWKVWTQKNLGASRKQVGPHLRNVMKQQTEYNAVD